MSLTEVEQEERDLARAIAISLSSDSDAPAARDVNNVTSPVAPLPRKKTIAEELKELGELRKRKFDEQSQRDAANTAPKRLAGPVHAAPCPLHSLDLSPARI